VDRADDITDRLMDFYRRVRAATARDTAALADDGPLFAACAELLGELMLHAPARDQVQCGKGCNFCCHQKVLISAVEARVIAADLRRRLPAAALAAMRALLTRRAAQSAAFANAGQHWRARLPCAFLAEDGGCSVHAVRPLVCRGYQSLSREACQEKYVADAAPRPPIDRYGHFAGNAVLRGLRDTLAAAGADGGLHELHGAVLAALAAG
jgi:Fe-S-cluster containining protein